MTTPSPQAVENIKRWRDRPDLFVQERFGVTPDPWQIDALQAFPTSPRMAMQACAGPGKTAVLAWLGWCFMTTVPHPMIGATSVSGGNLHSNLWPEFARWRERDPLLKMQFEQTDKAIFHRDYPQTWRIEARTWARDADAQQIGNSLAGLHSNYVMWLLDETGDYPEAVLPVCEGIFNGNPIRAHIVQAGNPTRRAGPLWRAASIARKLWKVIRITADPDDPARTPRVSVEIAKQQIEQYGRENPWVKVRIFGEFPETDFNALIGPEEVEASFRRAYRSYDFEGASLVFGVDVARFGDDQSVIFPRRGVQAFKPYKYRNLDSTQGSGRLVRLWEEHHADGVFIDNAGLGGGGWIDASIRLGKTPIGIDFASRPHNTERYANKRAEMYFDAVEWIKRGGALVEDPELLAALTQTTYSFSRDSGKLLLEPKESLKLKLGYSPDSADAFVLTFAEPVSKATMAINVNRQPYVAKQDFNPFREREPMGNAGGGTYDPFDPNRR
jgi:phage terminase large subunit